MSLTQIAVIVVAALFILIGANVEVSNTLYLIDGIIAVLLVILDGRINLNRP